MVVNLQYLSFGVEVVDPGHLDATRGDAEATVLDDLKLVEGCCGDYFLSFLLYVCTLLGTVISDVAR